MNPCEFFSRHLRETFIHSESRADGTPECIGSSAKWKSNLINHICYCDDTLGNYSYQECFFSSHKKYVVCHLVKVDWRLSCDQRQHQWPVLCWKYSQRWRYSSSFRHAVDNLVKVTFSIMANINNKCSVTHTMIYLTIMCTFGSLLHNHCETWLLWSSKYALFMKFTLLSCHVQ